ncbi:MAG: HAD-IIIA family hydrolase [Bacteroidetes bacterium]|nr:HAD-IIIA family hydrolase [Bacteroidota bacterium]MBS1755655.1 HAD-IIIA family hydrolase [Bacteroidota bacterium]
MNVLSLFKNIQLIVLDVDGVLTDGTLLLLEDGQMARRMNIKDGYAMQLAIKKGYKILIISGGNSEAVRSRLQKLGITDIYLGATNKKEILLKYVAQHHLPWSQVLYMGDDIPDIFPMQMVGMACCPADAAPEVKSVSHYISPISGGNGCVRDVIEKVLKLNNHWAEDESIASV